MIHQFRKKPVVIEAVQYTGENIPEIINFTRNTAKVMKNIGGSQDGHGYPQLYSKLIIPTLEGDHLCMQTDWIIQGVNGEFYPCKNDIFWKTYDRVEPDNYEGI